MRHFSTVHAAVDAIDEWVGHYNYFRPHQGIGGLLAPAERFHGQSKQVLEAIDQGIDITGQNGYGSIETERSLMNLSISPEGNLTLWVLGRPVEMKGVKNG